MYEGYMTIDGTEILNSNRTKAYAEAFLPGLEVKCDAPGLHLALMQSPYTTPAMDNAPWYKVTRPATGRFLGFHSIDIQGLDDSSETVTPVELIGSGGIHTTPRHRSKEIRVIATGMALDDEAMDEGYAWLKSVLSNENCNDALLGCTGRKVRMFSAGPVTSSDATQLGRTFYKVEKLEGPFVMKKMKSRGGVLWKIEFTLNAGRPWAWTDLTTVGTLAMNGASNFTEAAEDCYAADDPYASFIDDPYYTAISKPPQPPIIKPPNILDLTSWRRLTLPIPTMLTDRAGRAASVITVAASPTTPLQMLRLRFYDEDSGLDGCDYSGEFLINYLPAGSVMSIDGISEEITVTRSDGSVVPGGHLVFGSDGRPLMWPSLGCERTYTMTADMMPGQLDVVIVLEVSVRT
jgi:hypothetical protein